MNQTYDVVDHRGSSPTTDVVELLSTFIRFDTSNPGRTEQPLAEWISTRLSLLGVDHEVVEPAPGRMSVVARVAGRNRSRPALLVHGHLDVVPAGTGMWTHPPFDGVVADGYVWGRGAIDMKAMIAMIVSVMTDWSATGRIPERDIVFAFTADEECGGRFGAEYLVQQRPELFADCTEAIGEVGGFSISLGPGSRVYPIQVAEKGAAWYRLTASGTPGHGSLPNSDNAIEKLAYVVSELSRQKFDDHLTDDITDLLAAVLQAHDLAYDETDETIATAFRLLGPFGRILLAGTRNTLNVTGFHTDTGANTVPASAHATLDGRFLPGSEGVLTTLLESFCSESISLDTMFEQPALAAPFQSDLVASMTASLQSEDSAAVAMPYMLSGGTDAKHFSALGIRCYGFSPLQFAPEDDFVSLFHGPDERVGIAALRFGVTVLHHFLSTC